MGKSRKNSYSAKTLSCYLNREWDKNINTKSARACSINLEGNRRPALCGFVSPCFTSCFQGQFQQNTQPREELCRERKTCWNDQPHAVFSVKCVPAPLLRIYWIQQTNKGRPIAATTTTKKCYNAKIRRLPTSYSSRQGLQKRTLSLHLKKPPCNLCNVM